MLVFIFLACSIYLLSLLCEYFLRNKIYTKYVRIIALTLLFCISLLYIHLAEVRVFTVNYYHNRFLYHLVELYNQESYDRILYILKKYSTLIPHKISTNSLPGIQTILLEDFSPGFNQKNDCSLQYKNLEIEKNNDRKLLHI